MGLINSIFIYLFIGGVVLNLAWIKWDVKQSKKYNEKLFTWWEYTKGVLFSYFLWPILIPKFFKIKK